MGKRRRRAGVAEADEADEGNEEEEASAVPTMRPMEEKRNAMSRRMMREKERGKEIRRWTWKKISKFSSTYVIFPGSRDTGVLRGAPRIQGPFSHDIEPFHLFLMITVILQLT